MSAWWEQSARAALGVGMVVVGFRLARGHALAEHSETPVPPMTQSSAIAASAPIASATDAEEVALRLTEALGQASVDMPQKARGLADLSIHWRRMQAPWKDTLGHAHGRLVQLVALRTSAAEKPHTVTMKTGEKVTFDVRQWNMAEGSYSQREAIVAPTPTKLRFRLTVPPHASFACEPAVLGIGEGAKGRAIGDVDFVATVTVGTGPPTTLGSVTIGTDARDTWKSARFDLAPWSGKEVELELSTVAHRNKAVAHEGPLPPALALFGTPRITRRGPTRLPYNVLYIVVDALRPDVLASFHDPDADARKLAAKRPPGDALLPKIPGLTPALDALAKRSTIYRNAISAASLTRPGTIAMLSGVHGRDLGVSPLPWMLPEAMIDAYYRAAPPLLGLAMRRAGARTDAFVNNNFMLGYATVGVDMGFESIDDFRYRTADTHEVTTATLAALRAHKDERFFYFVNYNSPHDPYDPTDECLARVPKPPAGPKDDSVARYMAEACKDDAGIGLVLAELDALGLREKTLVVVTADHGETLSQAHEMIAEGLDKVNTRFHHAFANYEETTRIPIMLSLPGVVPEGRAVDGRVTNLDLVPTVATLLGLDRDPRWTGIDLVALAKSGAHPVARERPIFTYGRASAAVFSGKYRYVIRDEEARHVTLIHGTNDTITTADELFDLEEDPGETKSLADSPSHKAVRDELRALLLAAKVDPVAKSTAEAATAVVQLRFAGGGAARRLLVTIRAKGAKSLSAVPVGLAKELIVAPDGTSLSVATTTRKDAVVGLDLTVSPELTLLEWTFVLDDTTLMDDMVFGGPLGVTVPGLARGLLDAGARAFAASRRFPFVDPLVDEGAFVVRVGGPAGVPERVGGSAAQSEVESALKQAGYAK